MSVKKIISIYAGLLCLSMISNVSAAIPNSSNYLTQELIAQALGWEIQDNKCGGDYKINKIIYPVEKISPNAIPITSRESIFSQAGTSILQGNVTATLQNQQLISDKAIIYRHPETGKWNVLDLSNNVRMQDNTTLILAKKGRYFFNSDKKSLIDIIYRTKLPANTLEVPPTTQLTGWGKAYAFTQTVAKIYEFDQATFTTCPPLNPMWQVKASRIVLNKITGRGEATHAKIYLKNIPVFYFPYINFSIDKQRKSGFLWPRIGSRSTWGPYFLAPYYWNLAPNYDLLLTPGLLSKRGVQLENHFRYLTVTSNGQMNLFLLPNDRGFKDFQEATAEQGPELLANASPDNQPMVQSQLNRLQSNSALRKGFYWRDDSRFNENWTSHIDFNYAGDDYYLKDFGKNLYQITENQLLQEADINYKNQHWDFTGRVQAYQTLHPINEPIVQNQYRRFPQLILNADYPDQKFGLEYFINNEITHFEIRKNPGLQINKPIGNRLHTQPGISLPLSTPYFFMTPRLQLALTQYELYQNALSATPGTKRRALPIFDLATGLAFNRELNLFNNTFNQTLEPQLYYTYIPYRNQSSIPIFDTTVNTLTYDQIFNYNRFTGLDRIGDVNQLAFRVTSRIIDQESGLEKIRLGIGEIFYFAQRRVTLCNDSSCSDNPDNRSNRQRLSPISATMDYHVNPFWKFSADVIWNPLTKQLSNSAVNFQYRPDDYRVLNLGYSFARSGDIQSGISTTSSRDNLKISDVSFAWPLARDYSAVGWWSQNWNRAHLQNLIYGIQYDTCCWAVRLVGGRGFVNFDTQTQKNVYNTEFYIQFSLKGLGEIGTGNPAGLLNHITGYKSHFGQEIQ